MNSPLRTVDLLAAGLRQAQIFTADGVRLSARHDPPEPGSPDVAPGLGIVVAHGFTGSWRLPDQRRIVAGLTRRAGVVSVDFRGHGGSEGLSTVGRDETRDLDAAVAWARELGYRRVVTLGWSLGAAIVLRQASLAAPTDPLHPETQLSPETQLRPEAVIAVSGPSRWNYHGTHAMRVVQLGIGTRVGRLVLARLFGVRISGEGWTRYPAPPDRAAARLRGHPVLVVHGDADHYFPLDHARWLARASGAQLWVEPGMGHAEGAASAELIDRLGRWAAGS